MSSAASAKEDWQAHYEIHLCFTPAFSVPSPIPANGDFRLIVAYIRGEKETCSVRQPDPVGAGRNDRFSGFAVVAALTFRLDSGKLDRLSVLEYEKPVFRNRDHIRERLPEPFGNHPADGRIRQKADESRWQ